MTKISIVIPVLHARPRIGDTLESIRQQTYPLDQIETIIVDDGSSDQCVGIARTFLQRHGMQGTVLVTGEKFGTSASLNRGWQAANGEWIQFLDSDDLLAPNKLDAQIRQVSQLPDVICSSWQRLRPHEDGWQPFGPTTSPNLAEPVLLKLVSPQAGLLGPALIRKTSLEAVAGFSDGVVYPDGEHLMLKLWATGGKFVAAPSPSPLFFVRQARDSKARASNANLALQHLQNVVIAEAMLRQQKFGTLTRQERKEIARLCDWSLSELYESDWAAFQQYWQWLREIDPNFIPRHSGKLKLASLVLGYESAEGLAHALPLDQVPPCQGGGLDFQHCWSEQDAPWRRWRLLEDRARRTVCVDQSQASIRRGGGVDPGRRGGRARWHDGIGSARRGRHDRPSAPSSSNGRGSASQWKPGF